MHLNTGYRPVISGNKLYWEFIESVMQVHEMILPQLEGAGVSEDHQHNAAEPSFIKYVEFCDWQ